MYSKQQLNTYRTLSPCLLKKKEINLHNLKQEIINKRNPNNNKVKIYHNYNSYYKSPNTNYNNTNFRTIIKKLPNKLHLTRNSEKTIK